MPPLAVAFLVLSAIVLWAAVALPGSWVWKLPVVLFVPLLAFVVWHSVTTYEGWPTDRQPPGELVLVARLVVEPADGDPGRVFLWGVPSDKDESLLGRRSSGVEPRAYSLPYTRSLHEQVEKAVRQGRQGGRVALKRVGDSDGGVWKAYKLPPARSPRKGTP